MAYSLEPAYYVQHELSRLIIKSGTEPFIEYDPESDSVNVGVRIPKD